MDNATAVAALAAMAQHHRLAVFRILVQAGLDGLTVGEVRERLGIPAATLSTHLNVLRHAGLIDDTREGRVIRVRANYARMNSLVTFLTENCCAGEVCEVPSLGSAISCKGLSLEPAAE